MRNPFRILIVAEAGLVRDGLCSLLDLKGYAEIIAAIDGIGDLDRLPRGRDPHLAVLDTTTSESHWEAAVHAIKARWPSARVIVLTTGKGSHEAPDPALLGVNAHFSKTDRGTELIDIVRSVLEAERHRAGLPTEPLADHALATPASVHQSNPDGLSDREREVMRQIARGFRTREIALQLSLSEKTIEKHRANLMRKLKLRTAAAVAAYAIANGYVDAK